MKGRVYRRGNSWYYRFDIEPDPLTGKRQQVNGSGYRTEREAWKECPRNFPSPSTQPLSACCSMAREPGARRRPSRLRLWQRSKACSLVDK